jgi:hypothetical protein
MTVGGRARHSVRAVVWLVGNGAHGVTRPTNRSSKFILMEALSQFLRGNFLIKKTAHERRHTTSRIGYTVREKVPAS